MSFYLTLMLLWRVPIYEPKKRDFQLSKFCEADVCNKAIVIWSWTLHQMASSLLSLVLTYLLNFKTWVFYIKWLIVCVRFVGYVFVLITFFGYRVVNMMFYVWYTMFLGVLQFLSQVHQGLFKDCVASQPIDIIEESTTFLDFRGNQGV